jgi:hypothetical protein
MVEGKRGRDPTMVQHAGESMKHVSAVILSGYLVCFAVAEVSSAYANIRDMWKDDHQALNSKQFPLWKGSR